MKSNLDIKSIVGWFIAVILAVITTLGTSSSKINEIQTEQQVLRTEVNQLKENQREILNTVKQIDSNITDIKIILPQKEDKNYGNNQK